MTKIKNDKKTISHARKGRGLGRGAKDELARLVTKIDRLRAEEAGWLAKFHTAVGSEACELANEVDAIGTMVEEAVEAWSKRAGRCPGCKANLAHGATETCHHPKGCGFLQADSPEPEVVVVALTRDQVLLLVEAIDSHCYERAPEFAQRNSGYIIDPRLDRDPKKPPLDEEEREVAAWLDEHDAIDEMMTRALASLPPAAKVAA